MCMQTVRRTNFHFWMKGDISSLQEGHSVSLQFNTGFQSFHAVQWLDSASYCSVALQGSLFCRDLIFILSEIGKERIFFFLACSQADLDDWRKVRSPIQTKLHHCENANKRENCDSIAWYKWLDGRSAIKTITSALCHRQDHNVIYYITQILSPKVDQVQMCSTCNIITFSNWFSIQFY